MTLEEEELRQQYEIALGLWKADPRNDGMFIRACELAKKLGIEEPVWRITL